MFSLTTLCYMQKDDQYLMLHRIKKKDDINQGLKVYKETEGAVLLDVRTPEEVADGRIPGSVNIPLQRLDDVEDAVENLDTPLFVYCQSGMRSRKAAVRLEQMGYTNVTDLGGIMAYRGELER